jgi:L-alanine-DL-glutamate epimerase-like enolase superfamily enzyme
MSLYKDRSIAEEGHITLPEAPGLGLSLNEDALEYYASGPWG